MPLPSDYVGTTLTAPVKIAGPRGEGFVTGNNTVVSCRPSFVVTKLYTDAPALVTNGIVTSHAGANSATTVTRTPDGSLATGGVATLTPARNVVITVTHASAVVALSGTITGTRFGKTLTEAWSVTAGGTTKTFTGAKAFDTVTAITEVSAADASTDTIVMGSGKVFGLDFKCTTAKLLSEEQDGAIVTNGTIVKGSSAATADPRGTYTPNSNPNAALDFQVWYISDDLSTIFP